MRTSSDIARILNELENVCADELEGQDLDLAQNPIQTVTHRLFHRPKA